VNLTEWARVHDVSSKTAYRWFREGTLPVPAVRVQPRTILVNADAPAAADAGRVGLHARVSPHDQRVNPERQAAQLRRRAQSAGVPVVRMETEVGSGRNGARSQVRRLVADPKVTIVIVKHRDRLVCMYGQRPARNRALKALRCARPNVGVSGR
jgi:putative resolvase